MNLTTLLTQPEYGFLCTNEHLGKHIILLGLAGSYSYGTNTENSDFDIRGVALNSKSDLIGLSQYEQYVDDHTDTVIYTFNKMVALLLNCNPNTLEPCDHFCFFSIISLERQKPANTDVYGDKVL